jgi:wobble nucleotide-excising tRNase
MTIVINGYTNVVINKDGSCKTAREIIADLEAAEKKISMLEHDIKQKREIIRALRQDVITFEHSIMSKNEAIHYLNKRIREDN